MRAQKRHSTGSFKDQYDTVMKFGLNKPKKSLFDGCVRLFIVDRIGKEV